MLCLLKAVTNDIPVTYNAEPENGEENGEEVFLYLFTRIIKKETVFYPSDVPNSPVMWKIKNSW